MDQHEDEEGQHRQIEGWLEQTGTTNTNQKWSEVFDCKGEAQELLCRTGDAQSTTCQITACRTSAHNARRDGRSFELNDEEVVRRSTRHSQTGCA